jgi:hypothetical protein
MMDLELDGELDRPSNPLDLIERLAALNNWSFDRDSDDELSVAVTGGWSDYHVAITWLEEVEAIHVACAFDLKVPERRRGRRCCSWSSLVNEQLWLGHFDLWPLGKRGDVPPRPAARRRRGGLRPSSARPSSTRPWTPATATFQAFQFVVWAGKSAREGLEGSMLETVGEA